MTIKQISAENKRRRKKLFYGYALEERINEHTGETYEINVYRDYDPVSGKGSPLPRTAVRLYSTLPGIVHLPNLMMESSELARQIDVLGGLDKVAEFQKLPLDVMVTKFMYERIRYDFEFWAYTCAKIKDKRTGKDIPFLLRPAQLKLLMKLEEMRWAGVPIRIILLKARQWGGSTLVQIYMNWVQLWVKEGWSSAIVAEVEDQSRNIRNMFTHIAESHPKEVRQIELKSFEGSTKNRKIGGTSTVIGVGTAEKPNSLRSFNFYMLHLSEVGLWKDTPSKSAEDVVQSLRGMVNTVKDTLICMESTAKGTGNLFHREWESAVTGESGYAPVFVAWWEIEEYLLDLDVAVKDFVASWSEYERGLWEQGATLEGINWYRNKKHTERMDDWRMMEEFPSNAEEAFQSSGRRVFAHEYVVKTRKGIEKPIYQGELIADSHKGADALQNIKFAKSNKGGRLRLWALPNDPIPEDGKLMKDRYCAFADIGGRARGTDFCSITVLDRYWMAFGGAPERVASWHGHLDQDLFAWECARLAKWYQNALLAIEVNSLKKKETTDGDHSFTVLDEIVKDYPRLYSRTLPEKVRQGYPDKWGFHTNKLTKPMIIDALNGALRDELYIERDEMAVKEMDYYEIKEDGSYGAKDGTHDDVVITTAGAFWLATSHMNTPKLLKPRNPVVTRNKKMFKSEAVI